MKTTLFTFLILFVSSELLAQATLADVKSKNFKTTQKLKIEGETGYLVVPENRDDPSSREIRVKFVHLRSIAENPGSPVVYLEGGGGSSTWQAESPNDLTDWLGILKVSDLIFVDRRGTNDEALTHIWQGPFPHDFFVSEAAANKHYQKMSEQGLEAFKQKKVDVAGYNLVEHAKDINALTLALGLDKYSIFGFSFGSGIGMMTMQLYPDRIDKAILAGPDAPNQSFNYPVHLDQHLKKISGMAAQDSRVNSDVPDLEALTHKVMKKLAREPVVVTVKHPLTRKDLEVRIGSFGLGLILRLDIDDANDIPILPRLLYTIDQGDYSMLSWFVQKRLVFALAIPGHGINQALASGASGQRWASITEQATQSPFGNTVNFPFSAVKESWPLEPMEVDATVPLTSGISTLFITGDLDCRTPVEQTREIMKGFDNSIHVRVINAGHEQAMWDAEVIDEIIPAFLLGKPVTKTSAHYGEVDFLPLTGASKAHPSLR